MKTVSLIAGLTLLIQTAGFARAEISIDTGRVPFSYYGSYMAITSRGEPDGTKAILVNHVTGKNLWGNRIAFIIKPVEADKDLKIEATPSKVTLSGKQGHLEICFESKDVLRFRNVNMNVEITPSNTGSYSFFSEGCWYSSLFAIVPIEGKFEQDKLIFQTGATGTGEFAIANLFEEGYKPNPHPAKFDACETNARNNFESWRKKFPPVSDRLSAKAELSQYLLWSCVVAPRRYMSEYGILQSKNTMHAEWSWDYLFVAFGTAFADKDLAWQQIKLFFDQQAENGALADLITDWGSSWTCVKPPIQGIIFDAMIKRGFITPDKYPYLYEHLAKLTDFWMLYRDANKNGIPEYYRNNDTGWDNASIFWQDQKCESPELCAYLVKQMELLEYLANTLGKKEDALKWRAASERLLAHLQKDLWDGKQFFARNIVTGQPTHLMKRVFSSTDMWSKTNVDQVADFSNQCLIKYLPLILGKRLDDTIRNTVLNDLRTSGIQTKFGFASENPKSKFFMSDGYWRGPIWAPVNFLMIQALENCGEGAYAKSVAKDFCEMCQNSPALSENYDALTGRPLKDSAYTWSASVFLSLIYLYDLQ